MKTFVLDTSVLLYDPHSIFKFGRNIVQIPLVVIEEVDRFKRDPNENGRNARTFSRHVDRLRKEGPIARGVDLENGGKFLISVKNQGQDQNQNGKLFSHLNLDQNDNVILGNALEIKDRGEDVVLISKDINLRVKADVLGIKSDDYGTRNVSLDDLYTGVKTWEMAPQRLGEFDSDRFLPLEEEERGDINANEYVVLFEKNNSSRRMLGRFCERKGGIVPLIKVREGVWGIYPKNIEQQFAMDALLNNEIKLVSLVGKAGTGKTLLAIAAGLEQTLNKQDYSRVLLSRPVIPMGRDLGFLPGDVNDKLAPWMRPIFDGLDFLFDKKMGSPNSSSWEELIDRGILHVEPLTYTRGRSIPHQYFIIDESQNLSPHEIKTLITRAGEGTKVVLTGDCEQIDGPYLDSINNGLTYCVEKFKEEAIMGHVLLKVGERSALSEVAAKIL
ncbi:MAG: PhoH family protein [Bacteriovoracales bacterium]|nr:PhoH family protein [Bacteriovoracales bacterium]